MRARHPGEAAVAPVTPGVAGWRHADSAKGYRRDGKCLDWDAWCWGGALVALCAWFAWRVGAFTWYTDLPLFLADGRVMRLPLSFSSIDHPVHFAREQAVVDALRQWRFPRWIMSPQGGYPAEFYPLGGAFVVAAVYALFLGAAPVAVIHKLVVIGVFFLPPLAYWLIVRNDRLPPAIGFLAGTIHLFTRGNWLGGGSRELIDFGLWPNVLASYLALFVLLGGGAWVRHGSRRGLLLATGAATLAMYSNPRSVLGLVAVWAVVPIVAASEAIDWRAWRHRASAWWSGLGSGRHGRASRPALSARPLGSPRGSPRALLLLGGRGSLLALLAGLLSAALLVPLRAHQNLYRFIHYVDFTRPRNVWTVYNDAIPREVIWLAVVGVVVAVARPGFFGRALALLLLLSYGMILVAGWYLRASPLFAQLEGPRLMPMLRPATIFLAALGAHELARGALQLVRARQATVLAGLATAAIAWFAFFSAASPIPAENRGLPWLRETTSRAEFEATARAAYRLETLARPGDKPLVVGSSLSWHSAFWIGALTNRPAYYDDWAWFWRATDYEVQSALADELSALELPFLQRHGLTLLLIDTRKAELLSLASDKAYLQLLDPGAPGGYAIFRVTSPPGPDNGWVSLPNGRLTSLRLATDAINARGDVTEAGVATIFVNAFPRWRARVNGQEVPLGVNAQGYLTVPVPAGPLSLELYYVTEPAGWLARGLVLLGLVGLGLALAWPRLAPRIRASREGP